MTIAEVSKKYDITPDTLRYYEKIGLLRNVSRTKSGIRDFDEKSCEWIEFIKCMRSSGITIEVLSQYIDLMYQGNETAIQRLELLKSEKEKLLQKQQDLKNTLERLDYKIKVYTDIVEGKRKDFIEKL